MAKRDRCPLLIVAAAAAVVYTLTGFQPGFPASMVQAEEKASVAASSAAREAFRSFSATSSVRRPAPGMATVNSFREAMGVPPKLKMEN